MSRKEFLGKWRIVEMELWDSDFIDLERPGYIHFKSDNLGEFHFGAVHGWIDCRYGEKEGKSAVEFSWEGNDENDPACGRGWALMSGDRIEGRLFFHQGDDSGFTASRQATDRTRKRQT